MVWRPLVRIKQRQPIHTMFKWNCDDDEAARPCHASRVPEKIDGSGSVLEHVKRGDEIELFQSCGCELVQQLRRGLVTFFPTLHRARWVQFKTVCFMSRFEQIEEKAIAAADIENLGQIVIFRPSRRPEEFR